MAGFLKSSSSQPLESYLRTIFPFRRSYIRLNFPERKAQSFNNLQPAGFKRVVFEMPKQLYHYELLETPDARYGLITIGVEHSTGREVAHSMVFQKGSVALYCVRHHSFEEAKRVHEELAEQIRAGRRPWEEATPS